VNILYIAYPTEVQETETRATEYWHTKEVLSGLQKLGHTVITTITQGSGLVATKEKPLWVRTLRRTPVNWLYHQLEGELAILYITWIELKLLIHMLKPYSIERPRPDIIYSRHRWLNLELHLSIPRIREINGITADEWVEKEFGDRISRWLVNKIEHWSMKRGDRWIAPSGRIKQVLVTEYGIPEDKIAVIETGANLEIFRPLDKNLCKEKLGLDKGTHYILYAGSLSTWYDIEGVVNAMPSVNTPNTKLLIIGDGPDRAKVERLGQTVTGLVPQRELPYWIGASDVCLIPLATTKRNSRGPSPIKLYEYLGCNKPVIATGLVQDTGMSKAVDAGVIVATDMTRLATAIDMALSNPNISIGREYAVENGSWDRAVAKIAKLMEEAIT